MILYHFPTSPYSRRVRLTLALKGLPCELRDARAQPAFYAELCALNPFHTVPALLDGEHAVFDSAAINHYLDRKHPEPPLWPGGLEGARAVQLCALADGVLTPIIDLGLRYAPLHDHACFAEVKARIVGRVQRGLDRLAELVSSRAQGPLCGDAWGAADIAVFTMVAWLETMPNRVVTFPPARAMLELGWNLPASLRTWADPHRTRSDVLGLEA